MDLTIRLLVQLIITISVFCILFLIGRYAYKRISNNKSRFLNPKEYFPDEELETLKQVYYLIMILLFFIVLLYALIYTRYDSIGFCYLELILMLDIAITWKYTKWYDKIFFVLLIPYGSLTFILFGYTLVGMLDLIHLPVIIYLMKYNFDKFREYTDNNGLGITIVLLFSIIFVSFIATMFVEGSNPIDSLVMVSNAFTSNGYAVLGSTSGGKLNSLILVWSGYIISGVGTATLTVAILLRRFKGKIRRVEERYVKENEELREQLKQNNEELKDQIKQNNEELREQLKQNNEELKELIEKNNDG